MLSYVNLFMLIYLFMTFNQQCGRSLDSRDGFGPAPLTRAKRVYLHTETVTLKPFCFLTNNVGRAYKKVSCLNKTQMCVASHQSEIFLHTSAG